MLLNKKRGTFKRALAGNEIWITGIRADQSDNRQTMDNVGWYEANKIIHIFWYTSSILFNII